MNTSISSQELNFDGRTNRKNRNKIEQIDLQSGCLVIITKKKKERICKNPRNLKQ